MLYYKVKTKSDQIRISVNPKSNFLIKGELYTKGEVEKGVNANRVKWVEVDKHFDKVNINPKNTCFVFGARFGPDGRN